MKSKSIKKKISFEEQLKVFNQLGFKLNKGITPDDILILVGQEELDYDPYSADERYESIKSKVKPYTKEGTLKEIGREEIENDPFETMYYALADQTENLLPITNQCWFIDEYFLKSEGDNRYIFILENLKRISNNELNFKKIKSATNTESQTTLLSFELNKTNYNWQFQSNEWPTHLFSKIVELTQVNYTLGKFTGLFFDYNNPSHGVVIGWLTVNQKEEVINKTGLDIQWLY